MDTDEATSGRKLGDTHIEHEPPAPPPSMGSNANFPRVSEMMSSEADPSINSVWLKAPRRNCCRSRKNKRRAQDGRGGGNRNRFACLSRDVDIRDQHGGPGGFSRQPMIPKREDADRGPRKNKTSARRKPRRRFCKDPVAPRHGGGAPTYTEVDAAYSAKGVMGGGVVFAAPSPDGEKHASESISASARRRLPSDPIRGVHHRPPMPRSDYEMLTAYGDNVALEVVCGSEEADGELRKYGRVCTLSRIPYARINSDHPHQFVIDERFAVCGIERVARPHADGLCEWGQTSWRK